MTALLLLFSTSLHAQNDPLIPIQIGTVVGQLDLEICFVFITVAAFVVAALITVATLHS